MKNVSLALSALLISLFVTSCTVEKVDPNYAAKIQGTYVIKTYETNTGTSTPSGNDKVLVSRVDDKHAEIIVDYANTASNDLECNNASIVKTGETYEYSQSFSNAEVTGSVTGNTLYFKVVYQDGDWMELSAEK